MVTVFEMNERTFRATLDSFAAQRSDNALADHDLRELNECVVQQTLYASVIAIVTNRQPDVTKFVVQIAYLDGYCYGAEAPNDYFAKDKTFEHYVFDTRASANAMLLALLGCGDADV